MTKLNLFRLIWFFPSYSLLHSSSNPSPEIVGGYSNLGGELPKITADLSSQILLLTLRNTKSNIQNCTWFSRCGYCFIPVSDRNSTWDLKDLSCITEKESVYCAVGIESLNIQTHFVFIGLKKKCTANTNLFVKQADSNAARGSCIFLGVQLRASCDSRHAVKIWIQIYIMLFSILWLA
jgi:hypothetical protein